MRFPFAFPRRRLVHALAILALLVAALPAPGAVQAVSQSVVISQVYGGGGNSGAPLTHDFVELFNRGTEPVSLAGMSVQYASASGTGNFGASSTQLVELPSVILQPGQYLLIQEAGATTGSPLPTPDVVDPTPIAMAGASGKVALVTGTTSLGCNGGSAPCSASQLARIVDLVGYGGANFYEGAAAPGLSNTTAALRNNAGCMETDNNAADFTAGSPAPRNSATPVHSCAGDAAPVVSSVVPTNNAVGVAVNTSLVVNFSEPVTVSGNWYTLSCPTSGAHTAAVTGGPESYTIDPDTDFVMGETCIATVVGAQVTDLDGNDPPDSMPADFVWSFTTVEPPVFIHDIQGAGHLSPKAGSAVSDVYGIVTALRLSGSVGFYLQDPNPDADPATSEGIFVFTNRVNPTTLVALGDEVLVSGRVSEYRPGTGGLTLTEITGPTVEVVSSGNPLPAPVVIGLGGLVPPTAVIEDDASNVETNGVFDPAQDGIDFYEALEGMLVQVNDGAASGPTNAFGEISLLPDNGAFASVRTGRGGVVIQPGDFNPERVIVDDEILKNDPAFRMPLLTTGDMLAGATVGVMDYSFGNFKLMATNPDFDVVDSGLMQEVAPAAGLNQVSVGTFNVENLDPTDPQEKFDQLASLIVNNLRSPDILAVEEIQDNTGAANDGTVAADQTFAMLIEAVQAAGGPLYDFRQVNPVNGEDGGEPGGNIRVGFLFRTDRGVTFVDRPGAESTTANEVVAGAAGPELLYSPGRIDPTNIAFEDSRKPLAGEFMFNGSKLFVIANHFNSKGGDQPLFGVNQPPVLSSEVQRLLQAQVVHDFAADILAADPNANVIVLGDLNDFEFSAPIDLLEGSILHALIETLPLSERYTYVYDGNSQAIDHILVSNALVDVQPFIYDVVHVNAEFPVATRASDHDPQVAIFTLYPFSGFFQPVENLPVMNFIKAGSVVPVKFSLGGDLGMDVFAPGYPVSETIACDSSAPVSGVEEVVMPGSSHLSYDPFTMQYQFAWKTDKSWAGTCRLLIVRLSDGTFHYIGFQLK